MKIASYALSRSIIPGCRYFAFEGEIERAGQVIMEKGAEALDPMPAMREALSGHIVRAFAGSRFPNLAPTRAYQKMLAAAEAPSPEPQ